MNYTLDHFVVWRGHCQHIYWNRQRHKNASTETKQHLFMMCERGSGTFDCIWPQASTGYVTWKLPIDYKFVFFFQQWIESERALLSLQYLMLWKSIYNLIQPYQLEQQKQRQSCSWNSYVWLTQFPEVHCNGLILFTLVIVLIFKRSWVPLSHLGASDVIWFI